jgi:hypothetical protein
MDLKKVVFSIGRISLRLTLLLSMLVGFLIALYATLLISPYLLMSEIDEVTAREQRAFYVAFTAASASREEVGIVRYGRLREAPPGYIRSFRLPDGEVELEGAAAAGESRASIRSETDNQGIQTTTVHVVGDMPWVSVSLYEVDGEEIVPVKLGQAGLWLLGPGFLAGLFLVFLARRPVGRIAETAFPPEN